ncbi:MAG: ABC transporter permease [Alphaproteobacteria bacterium]|nr:ABC transporter permease [Alphaproteobacteria bacterium]
MNRSSFLKRFTAILAKEFVQMRRDRLTFAMMIGVPIMQLILFGYAINADPRKLPTAVVATDASPFSRSLLSALDHTGYFAIDPNPYTAAEAQALLARGKVQFVITIPSDFARSLERGERPAVLIEADATDPGAIGGALAAMVQVANTALAHDLIGPLARLNPGPPPFEVRVHRLYNPEGLTQHNIVPGLIGLILTMTMIMMTSLAMTRERERGTFENLLAMPVRPFEVMLGKIVPYIFVGAVQVTVILTVGHYLFGVPMVGSLLMLSGVLVIFIAANLTIGFTFSTIAKNQLQAMQMTFFFFLPSILLSGFMFPFRGMPAWAQTLGEVFPLTHFLRVVRGVMLKGASWAEIQPEVWPLLAFMGGAMVVAMLRYRRTLD